MADYYIRQGHYESARDVYEEGLTTVITVTPDTPPELRDVLAGMSHLVAYTQYKHCAGHLREMPLGRSIWRRACTVESW